VFQTSTKIEQLVAGKTSHPVPHNYIRSRWQLIELSAKFAELPVSHNGKIPLKIPAYAPRSGSSSKSNQPAVPTTLEKFHQNSFRTVCVVLQTDVYAKS